MKKQLEQIGRKIRRQIGKDYIFFPAADRSARSCRPRPANGLANLARNLWSYMIIFCGHFPDGALHFTEEELEDETRAEWYLRQMLGSANFTGSPFLHIMSGNLGYQIEHHLFPDLPSNRYAEISEKVRPLCEKYGIPYTTGPLYRQYGQALRTITKLSLPNKFTKPKRHDDPETPRCRADVAATTSARPVATRRASGPRGWPRRDRPARRGQGIGELPFASMGDLGLDKRQGHPVRPEPDLRCVRREPGVGRSRSSARAEEAGRNEFHFPPAHVACAEAGAGDVGAGVERGARPPARRRRPGRWSPRRASSSSGHGASGTDRRPVFSPNSVIEERSIPA